MFYPSHFPNEKISLEWVSDLLVRGGVGTQTWVCFHHTDWEREGAEEVDLVPPWIQAEGAGGGRRGWGRRRGRVKWLREVSAARGCLRVTATQRTGDSRGGDQHPGHLFLHPRPPGKPTGRQPLFSWWDLSGVYLPPGLPHTKGGQPCFGPRPSHGDLTKIF